MSFVSEYHLGPCFCFFIIWNQYLLSNENLCVSLAFVSRWSHFFRIVSANRKSCPLLDAFLARNTDKQGPHSRSISLSLHRSLYTRGTRIVGLGYTDAEVVLRVPPDPPEALLGKSDDDYSTHLCARSFRHIYIFAYMLIGQRHPRRRLIIVRLPLNYFDQSTARICYPST